LSQTFSSTITPKNLQNISEYDSKGYGVWSYDENLMSATRRDDIMSAGYTPLDDKSVKLLKFFAITDIHITDKESPSQLIYLQPANPGTSNGQLMIIACHVPIAVSPHESDNAGKDTYMDWYENTRTPAATMENAVTLPDLITELHSHPNLLMWMAGHRHVNTVKAFVHDNAEQGFWQVETSSLHDFPQQMRLFDIRLNSDYTISINATNVDPAVKEGTPAYTARKYAVAAGQIAQTELSLNFAGADPKYPGVIDPTIKPIDTNTGSYNAELLKELSPTMKAKMQALFPSV